MAKMHLKILSNSSFKEVLELLHGIENLEKNQNEKGVQGPLLTTIRWPAGVPSRFEPYEGFFARGSLRGHP